MGIQGTQTDDEDTVQEGDLTALCNTVIVRCVLLANRETLRR